MNNPKVHWRSRVKEGIASLPSAPYHPHSLKPKPQLIIYLFYIKTLCHYVTRPEGPQNQDQKQFNSKKAGMGW